MTSMWKLGFVPCLPAALTAALVAQNPAPSAPETGQPPAVATKKSAAQWIEELGSDSYRTRLDAEQALRALGKQAVPELEKAAAQAKDAEVQWRARRLLRQIEAGEAGGLQQRDERRAERSDRPLRAWPWGPSNRAWADDLHERFDELFQRMEQDFGLDIPRGRFFQDDFFRDLEQQFRQFDAQGGHAQGQSLSMQIGPDGKVRVEVQKTDAQGNVDKQVYEAPDLETFHQQHPGVLPQGGPGGMRWFFQGGSGSQPSLRVGPLGGRLQRLWADRDGQGKEPAPADAETTAPADGPRLGVFVRDAIPAELREHLDLPEGHGLMVESVQDGSLAAALGLQRGDIVLEVAGRPIGTTADVQQALAGVAAGAEVSVKFLRKGQPQVAKAVPPAPAAANHKQHDDTPSSAPRRGKRLERRDGKGQAPESGGR